MVDATPRRRRVRPSFRRFAIVAFVLLVPLAFHALWDYIEARRLSSVVEQIRAKGEPVHFGRLGEGGPVTPEQKRASKYYGAAALLTTDAYGAQFSKAGELIDAMSGNGAPISPTDTRLSTLRSLVDSYSPALDLLDRATPLDANGLDYASEPRFGFPERNIANVNALRIADRALTGEGDAAAMALIGTLRLRRAMRDRFALTYPVRTMDSLRSIVTFSMPSEGSLRALQDAYREREDENGVERQLLRSRGTMIAALWPGAHGELASLPRVRNPRPQVYLFDGVIDTALRPWYTNRFRRMLSIYDEAVVASRQPWPAKLDAAATLETRYPMNRQPFGTRSTFGRPPAFFENGPAADFARIARQTASTLTETRVCITVLALERYLQVNGQPPSSLDALAPQFLSEVPKDPYTGTPLRYVFTRTEYKVYGAGSNRRDDGGDIGMPRSDLSPPAKQPQNDIGIAVPLRKQRSTP